MKNSDVNAHVGGVALLINKKIKHFVTKTRAISARVLYLVIKLNSKCNIQVIQAYAPTSVSTNEEHEKFLEDLTTTKSTEKTRFTIMMGDFNSKIGQNTQMDPPYIGTFGLGERNQRGQEMRNFLSKEKIYCMNTFFKKHPKRKWTWKSSENSTKNEIGYVLVTDKRICVDVSVLNRFDTGSDHRLVRAKIQVDTRLERKRLMEKKIRPTMAELKGKEEEYNTYIERKLCPVEDLKGLPLKKLTSKITSSIRTAVKQVCSLRPRRNPKISPDTERLIEERSNTDRDSPRYRDFNKAVQKAIRRDHRAYNTQQINEAIADNMKSCDQYVKGKAGNPQDEE
ncbi:craniofacial development protein 2-like [Polyergus mexicanus]|uniref:craniofacial development protein 2-like n=1 Tax=Polyergus mexicanus TaxID=615972 RepID=UPI0038B590CD